ncbi:hypothetical protein Tco_0644078 [Tanacetum coccineum]
MKRGFRGVPRPLLLAMLLVTNPNAGQDHPDVAQSQPSSSTIPVPSPSSPPKSGSEGEEVEWFLKEEKKMVFLKLLKWKNLSDQGERKAQVDPLRVASQKPKSIDKGRRYKRRKETKGKKVVTSLDFQEEVSTDAEGVNTAEGAKREIGQISYVSFEKLLNRLGTNSTEEASLAELTMDTLEERRRGAYTSTLGSLLVQQNCRRRSIDIGATKEKRALVQFVKLSITQLEDWVLLEKRLKLMQSCQRVC